MRGKRTLPADAHIGARIKSRRMQIGMSQESLGKKLGLTFQQIQKYEAGTNRVSGARLLEAAKALNVPVTHFYEGIPGGDEKNGGVGADDKLRAFTTDRNGLAIVGVWEDLKPKMRAAFADLVRATAGA